MSDRERHREVRQLHAYLVREGNELLDGGETSLVSEMVHSGLRRAEVIVFCSCPIPTGQGAAGEWTVDERAHAVALDDRQDLAFDLAVENRVVRLLGAEPFEPAPL